MKLTSLSCSLFLKYKYTFLQHTGQSRQCDVKRYLVIAGTLGPAYNEQLNPSKCACYNRVFAVIELVISGTQWSGAGYVAFLLAGSPTDGKKRENRKRFASRSSLIVEVHENVGDPLGLSMEKPGTRSTHLLTTGLMQKIIVTYYHLA